MYITILFNEIAQHLQLLYILYSKCNVIIVIEVNVPKCLYCSILLQGFNKVNVKL